MKLSEAIRLIQEAYVEEMSKMPRPSKERATAVLDRACAAVVKAQSVPAGNEQELTAHLNRLDQQEEAASGN